MWVLIEVVSRTLYLKSGRSSLVKWQLYTPEPPPYAVAAIRRERILTDGGVAVLGSRDQGVGSLEHSSPVSKGISLEAKVSARDQHLIPCYKLLLEILLVRHNMTSYLTPSVRHW